MTYDFKHAEQELSELGERLISRAEVFADNYNVVELAKLLVMVNKEVYRIEEEARRLRLTGQLKLDIYHGMVRGYRAIVDQIFKIAYNNSIADEVRTVCKALKFSNDLAGTYLAEYLHETEGMEK